MGFSGQMRRQVLETTRQVSYHQPQGTPGGSIMPLSEKEGVPHRCDYVGRVL
jgi:hypothetical protein